MQMSVACNLIPLGDRLDSDPTVDFLDALGLNGLCSLSWCLHKYYHVPYVIAKMGLCHDLVNFLAIIRSPITCIFYLLERLHKWTHGHRSIFLHRLQPLFINFHHHYSTVHFHIFIYFTIQLTTLFSARPERLTTFPPLGAKYLVECVQVYVCWRLSARDLQHSICCWFQSPTGSINLGSLNEGKLLLTTSTPSLGALPNYFNIHHQAVFWRRCRGLWSCSKGSLIRSISLLCFCLACFIFCLVYFHVSKF